MTSPAAQISSPPAGAEAQRIGRLPVLVLFPHNRCNCRCVMCDIWRIRQVREITAADLEKQLQSLRDLQVRWVVLSGGEPQLHSDLAALCKLLRVEGVRVTLLTAGLLLRPQAELVAAVVDDLIVSLDGPPAVHEYIRQRPRAFERLAQGIAAVRRLRPQMPISARCTVQKSNHRHLCATASTAKVLELNSISFLAADLTSSAFNRASGWTQDHTALVALSAGEVDELERELDRMLQQYAPEIASGFIAESRQKLKRIALHFRAHLGLAEPVSPICNAPWVSAVVEADGTVRPCFFHPPLGNISSGSLQDVLNSESALAFRQSLSIADNPICRRCVCSLHWQAAAAEGQS
ncbi:MAG TPA: radical SAM protein [Terriglobales bacterium]